MADVTENATETAEETANDLGLAVRGDEGEDDLGVAPPTSLTERPAEPEASEEKESKGAEEATEGEEDEEQSAAQSLLEQVEAQLAGAATESPKHPEGLQELQQRVAELQARLQGRDDVAGLGGKEEAVKAPSPIDELRSPAVAKMVRDAIDSEDPNALNNLLVEMNERVASHRVAELESKFNEKLSKLEETAQTRAWAATAQQQMNAAVGAIDAMGEAMPAARELARDYRENGTNSRLWALWSKNPTMATDPQMLTVAGLGLAATYQQGLSQNGTQGATPAAPPAARDRSTGAGPKASRREANLNKPKTTPQDEQERLRENVAANLRAVLGESLEF